jgi:hypothetical protein
MTQANDSILVTPGTGATVATHNPGDGKEYQVVMLAGPAGHLYDTLPTYYFWKTFAAGAANQRTIDIFNASGSGKVLRVKKLFIQCSMAAITGVGHQFDLIRTTAVGTGGTGLTAGKADTGNANLPAQVTARALATGGATEASVLFSISVDPEETRPGAAIMGMINWIPEGPNIQEVVLREGEGLLVKQITNNTAASWGCLLAFTVE